MSEPMIKLNNLGGNQWEAVLVFGAGLREQKCDITLLIRNACLRISIPQYDVGLTRFSRSYESLTLTHCLPGRKRNSTNQVSKQAQLGRYITRAQSLRLQCRLDF